MSYFAFARCQTSELRTTNGQEKGSLGLIRRAYTATILDKAPHAAISRQSLGRSHGQQARHTIGRAGSAGESRVASERSRGRCAASTSADKGEHAAFRAWTGRTSSAFAAASPSAAVRWNGHTRTAPGQAQFGIDILVRVTDGTFEVWQTKRYRRFTPADVREAIRLFLKHKWAEQAKKFVLAVACELDATTVVDAIETSRKQLRENSILFEPLGGSQLTERLRTSERIVDDFFDRPWVRAVCPPEALQLLGNRISRFARKRFGKHGRLLRCMGSDGRSGNADSGT